ncbi:unnamed protein product [Miscanthus lutarioriparius]|uniref:Peptidase S26 domain-containing protein n=1 Tax=Miscanthus lutarioriparius TaxID=422564 RepID=A0A811QPL7_9POAL|nr:unnamed protein product [Miscanthus lutarioriparius]
MARALLVKGCITGSVVGITVADWVASVVSMDGASRHPTFDPQQAERALVEKRCLYRYDFSRGDVVVFRSPRNHRELMVKRLIALPGDWIQIPEKQEIRQTPEGHSGLKGTMPPSALTRDPMALFLWKMILVLGSSSQGGHPTPSAPPLRDDMPWALVPSGVQPDHESLHFIEEKIRGLEKIRDELKIKKLQNELIVAKSELKQSMRVINGSKKVLLDSALNQLKAYKNLEALSQ